MQRIKGSGSSSLQMCVRLSLQVSLASHLSSRFTTAIQALVPMPQQSACQTRSSEGEILELLHVWAAVHSQPVGSSTPFSSSGSWPWTWC